jgi:hypothetical protein
MMYWDYYRDDVNWTQLPCRPRNPPSLVDTVAQFESLGYSEDEAHTLWRSGYATLPGYEQNVIDRYYGGLLTWSDRRTRLPISELRSLLAAEAQHAAEVFHANSWNAVEKIISEKYASHDCQRAFRGQTCNYVLDRAVPNPYLSIPGIGEISLVPSLWRAMLRGGRVAFPDFVQPGPLEWSSVLYQAFDMAEIERRHQNLLETGHSVYTVGDMEDCGDPLLEEFGRIRGELLFGNDLQVSITNGLQTLLQHYGLLSNMLDLSTDLEIARFFATHKFSVSNGLARYDFVGTNHGHSVIYVFRPNGFASYSYENERLWERLTPLRPQRQSCVTHLTDTYCINLPADFLEAVIFLDFDDIAVGDATAAILFPDAAEDRFLQALLNTHSFKDHATTFNHGSAK